jgi:hypothetical protein
MKKKRTMIKFFYEERVKKMVSFKLPVILRFLII